MSQIADVALDTGVLSLVTDKPNKNIQIIAAQNWLNGLLAAGVNVYVPEICDYELRRELTRAKKTTSLTRLDTLIRGTNYLAITTPVMHYAAQLWANARMSGIPTADDTALDGDVILCAQIQIALPATSIVATTNVKHINRFVQAAEWQSVAL